MLIPGSCEPGDADCDGQADEDEDQDEDGYSSCDGDCDDEDGSIHPGADDVPVDGIDQDCNGWDMGNCETDILDRTYTVDFYIEYWNCTGTDYGFSALGRTLRVHQSAYCTNEGSGTTRASWQGDWSGESGSYDLRLEGNWWAEISGSSIRDGGMNGSGYNSLSGSCDNASARLE